MSAQDTLTLSIKVREPWNPGRQETDSLFAGSMMSSCWGVTESGADFGILRHLLLPPEQ